MGIGTHLVGLAGEGVERTWTADDALLYALAVGAGRGDPRAELDITTENSAEVEQRALPAFANIALAAPLALPGDVDLTTLLHAEQAFEMRRPLPVTGSARSVARITDVFDKGADAIVVTETVSEDDQGILAVLRTTSFFRGAGGFGGERGPRPDWKLPERAPDAVVPVSTRPEQAFLYRLTGDRNPLHSDPVFAARAGFPRPILHGMCTFGITARVVEQSAGDGVGRLTAMSGRFTRSVFPGDALEVSVWADGGEVRFRTTDATGAVVIDHGRAVVA